MAVRIGSALRQEVTLSKFNEELVKFICFFEGFRENKYICPGGHYSFGYGSLVRHYPEVKFPVLREQAKEYMIKDLEVFEKELEQIVPLKLLERERFALMSFIYNLGARNLQRSSLLKSLKAGDKLDAGNRFMQWIMARGKNQYGLIRRRAFERDIFLGYVDYKKINQLIGNL